MKTSPRGIAIRAASHKKHRFGSLYGLLNEENLAWCFDFLRKDAAPGVDRVDYREYQRNLASNIHDLVERLKTNRYRAKLVRRRYIPKLNGKMRPLGIPATEDKLVQVGVAKILEAIYEQDFLEWSYGYRPQRSPQDAATALTHSLHYGRYCWVVEADIKGFFDNIDHDWMIRMLEERIDDKPFLRLIRKWLQAGILETDGKVVHPVTGTPQGNAVELSIEHLLGFFRSPFAETLLSNSWLRGSRNFRTIIFDTVDLLQDVLKDCDGSFWVNRGKHSSF